MIIFDLDDTLIDTSGSILPDVLKNALIAMEGVGLSMASFNRSYDELLRLNTFHVSSGEAIREFLEINKAPAQCLDVALKAVYESPIFNEPIQPVEDAIEVLEELSVSHPLVLVTKGKEKIQREKMKRAGISTQFFTKLYFCTDGDKKKIYQKVSEEMGISPLNALVCGDRISIDLTPAKELGYKTVQLKWGRGLGNTGFKKDVDYTILYLKELKALLEIFKIVG
ncbi:MAG: HAD family hydrolase [Candidatus Neptunochlamydia sp.]|nr:HAD family hydrolase [Candidatus Neptunochlamydia sp.]